jgi:hypothetical protein
MTEFAYKVGPLVFSSNVELCYTEAPVHSKMAAISVVDELPESPAPQGQHAHEVFSEQGVWIFSDGVAHALVCSGERAYISRASHERDRYLAVVTLVLRTLLVFHGVVLLHASAVAKSDGAWIWFGNSGSGKSTAATRGALEGSLHLSDDVAPLCFNSDGQVCTFQCDRFASLIPGRCGAIQGLADVRLPQVVSGVRPDGKQLYRISPPCSGLFPVVRLTHLSTKGVPSQFKVSSSECLRLLIQSAVGCRLVPHKVSQKLLAVIAALVQQVSSVASSAGGDSKANLVEEKMLVSVV